MTSWKVQKSVRPQAIFGIKWKITTSRPLYVLESFPPPCRQIWCQEQIKGGRSWRGLSIRWHSTFCCIAPCDHGYVEVQPIYPAGPPQVRLKLCPSLDIITVFIIDIIWSCMAESPEYLIFMLYLVASCSAEFTSTALVLEGHSRGCSLKLVNLTAASEVGWGAWLLSGSKIFSLSSTRTTTVFPSEKIT